MTADAVLFTIWLLYVVMKDIVAPLVKYVIKRKNNGNGHMPDERLAGLKDELQRHREETDRHNALDDKLDIVLEEIKGLGERLAIVETHIQHILGVGKSPRFISGE